MFLHEKSPYGPCFEFESTSHRRSKLRCILTLMYREIAGSDERVRAIPGVQDRQV